MVYNILRTMEMLMALFHVCDLLGQGQEGCVEMLMALRQAMGLLLCGSGHGFNGLKGFFLFVREVVCQG